MKAHQAVTIAAVLACGLWTSGASAQSHEVVTTTGPNRALLHTGIFVFGVPYVASVIVAASSDHQGDHNLYLPVVGPWMDLAGRGSCGNLGEMTCGNEAANKVLLVVDGVFQGLGALDIVGAFVFPETRTISTPVGYLPVRLCDWQDRPSFANSQACFRVAWGAFTWRVEEPDKPSDGHRWSREHRSS